MSKTAKPGRFILGRDIFRKISAVEGVCLNREIEEDFRCFDELEMAAAERRLRLKAKYGSSNEGTAARESLKQDALNAWRRFEATGVYVYPPPVRASRASRTHDGEKPCGLSAAGHLSMASAGPRRMIQVDRCRGPRQTGKIT